MADESPELIEKEMEQTRQSLTDKVAALENTVVGTIQTAASTVQETVQTVKDAMQETVSTVKESVTDSVESVSEGIKQTFDISSRVRENPWLMVGGAAAAGFVTGLLVFRPKSIYAEGLASGHAHRVQPTSHSPYTGTQASYAAAPERSEPRRPSWVDDLWEMFGREAKKIGEQALTVLAATAKQSIEQGVPKLFDSLAPSSTCHATNARRAGGPAAPQPGYSGQSMTGSV